MRDTIAFAEGYFNGAPVSYDSYFGDGVGGQRRRFTSYDRFPGRGGAARFGGVQQSANGRYQINERTYEDFGRQLGVSDFTPESQDRLANQILISQGAMQQLRRDDFAGAVHRASGRWQSLPMFVNGQWVGRPTRRGPPQRFVPFSELQRHYEERLRYYRNQR